MSIGVVNLQGCLSCAYQLRAVGGVLVGGGDPTKMLAWIAAYDIDTVPWGALQTGNFTSPAQTTPPTQSGGSIAGVLTGSLNNLNGLNTGASPPCTVSAANPPIAYRAQVLLPFPTAYYFIAFGLPMDAALAATCGEPVNWVAQGCAYPQQPDSDYPMIVDLDIPDDALDASILVQSYYLGIISPGAGYSNMNGPMFAVQQDLAGMGMAGVATNAVGMSGFGPNWDPSAVCAASPEPSTADPFS